MRKIAPFLLAAALTLPIAAQDSAPVRRAVFGMGESDEALAEVCRFVGKEHPKVLVFETPSNDNPEKIKRHLEAFRKCGAEAEAVRLTAKQTDVPGLRRKIAGADLVWLGSGATERLVLKSDEYFLDEAFRLAYRHGTAFAGNSAGSIMQAYAGYNDFNDGRWDFIRGLDLIHVYFVPHYQAEVWQGFDNWLKSEFDHSLPDEGWAVENGAGVFFTNEKPEVRVMSSGAKLPQAFHFVRKNGQWHKTAVAPGKILGNNKEESK